MVYQWAMSSARLKLLLLNKIHTMLKVSWKLSLQVFGILSFPGMLLEQVLTLMACWTSWHSVSWWFWWRTHLIGPLMSFNTTCCFAEIEKKLIKYIPPSWAECARRFQTRSPGGTWPVSPGMTVMRLQIQVAQGTLKLTAFPSQWPVKGNSTFQCMKAK